MLSNQWIVDLDVGSDASRSMFVLGPKPTQPERAQGTPYTFCDIFLAWRVCIAVKKMNSETCYGILVLFSTQRSQSHPSRK